jgi:hypothetical protein
MPPKERPAQAKAKPAKPAKLAQPTTGAAAPNAPDISMEDAFAAVFKKMQAGMKADLRD